MRLFSFDVDAELRATEAQLAQVRGELAEAEKTIAALTAETAALRQGTEAANSATLAAQGRLDEAKAHWERLDRREADLPQELTLRVNTMVGQRLAKVGADSVSEDLTTDPTTNSKATWTERSIQASRGPNGQETYRR